MSSLNERNIKDVRDIWNTGLDSDKENPKIPIDNNIDNRTKHKYKTLERHLSMKKTIRRKMMRDLREIGDAQAEDAAQNETGFLEQIRNDQPAPANVDKPSLWKRLTKGWGH
ncbi:unnamed protein product [Psylliodes chrysocephalus]|uniref:Uncharacterized protein n=1 Tax=Psylliodes chrysocephalus TaxID=3402493 RepID=A0A9P0CQA9_9CUCU|nr:unnamed protein product [Psylliodes chrysocephala]